MWNNPSGSFGGRFGESRGSVVLPPAIKLILIANGVVFLLQRMASSSFDGTFGLSPIAVANGEFWQLFTYMFLHGGYWHIIINMLMLWMFGRDLERDWGTRSFVKFYLTCGIGAGLITVLFQLGLQTLTIGASGAIFGVLLAFGMAYPNREITLLLFFVLPVKLKAKYLVAGLAILQVLMLQDGPSGVAYLTHLAGLAVAFVYLKIAFGRFHLPRPLAWIGHARARRKGRNLRKKWDEQRDLMESMDKVLDRINEVGFENLTAEEKKTLERASDRLSSDNPNS